MTLKKLQKSVDSVRSDVRELTEAFWALHDEITRHQALMAAEQQSASANGHAPTTGVQATATAPSDTFENGDTGGGAYRWSPDERPLEDALSIPVDAAARILAAIGHRQRLAILLLLLRQPATASELVRTLGLGTTGAAYHHLNVLQGAGLVGQEQRGTFSIVPDRVPALVSILAGLSGAVGVSTEERPLADGS